MSDPENGYAQISENGNQLSYSPDSNYSGLDYFSIGVIDNGGVQNSLPQQVTIPVSINVTQLDDAPFFASSPPTDSNLPDVISWNDEEDYIYNVLLLILIGLGKVILKFNFGPHCQIGQHGIILGKDEL